MAAELRLFGVRRGGVSAAIFAAKSALFLVRGANLLMDESICFFYCNSTLVILIFVCICNRI